MKIVISAVLALFLIGCSSDESKQVQNEEPTQIVQDVEQEIVVEEPEQEVIVEETEQETVVEDAEQEIIIEDTVDLTEVGIVEDVVVVETSIEDGGVIYKACSTCHGVNAEKAALGKSKIIQGWSTDQVAEALYGYKNGTYGAAMKGIMKAQVSKLSDEDIELVAEYISTL